MLTQIDSLMFEVTRFCNMTCPHCVRGDSMRVRMKKETITKVLEQIDYIPTIMFTGGEPALALDLIQFTLSECRRLGVSVGNFWMATNGTVTSKKFFDLVRDWLEYCGDNDISGLRISIDNYHDDVNIYPFKYFEEELEYNSGVTCYFEYSGAPSDTAYLISDGRAAWNYPATKAVEHSLVKYDNRIEGTTYINVYGDVISTCDISYDTQDEKSSEFNLGNVHKNTLDEIYDRFFENHPENVEA